MPTPRYVLIASSTCDQEDTPELFSGTMARFYATFETAQAAMIEDFLGTISDAAKTHWDANGHSKELRPPEFFVEDSLGDCNYRIESTVATWESYGNEGSAISTWQILTIPDRI